MNHPSYPSTAPFQTKPSFFKKLGFFVFIIPVFIPLAFAAPINDKLTKAVAIAEMPYTHQQSTLEASKESAEANPECAGETAASVWYQYTPTRNQTVVFDTFDSDYDTVLSLWRGNTHPLTSIECNDDQGVEQSQLSASLQAGVTYYINVSGYQGHSGQLVLNAKVVNPLSNDNLAEATEMTGPKYTNTQTTSAATQQTQEANNTCNQSGASVWYQYTPTTAQKIIFDTIGSDYDTVLSVWTGNNHPLTEIACGDNSDNESSLQSKIDVALAAGTTYYISVTGVTDSEGIAQTGILVFNATSRPSNDDIAKAIRINPPLPYTNTQNTNQATIEDNEARSSCEVRDSTSVWYQYIPSTDQNVSISTLGSDYDTVLSIWTGNAHPLNFVACNDDAITDNEKEQASQISLPLKKTTNYWFKISGLSEATSQLILRVEPIVNDIKITGQPTHQTIDYAQAATLTVQVSGTKPFSYQWYQGESGDTSQPSVNTQTFTTSPLTETASYWVRVTNPTGLMDSQTATLTIKKPNGKGLDANGNKLPTKAHFIGHVATDEKENTNQVTQLDTIAVTASLLIDPSHNGQKADIIIIALYQTAASKHYYMRRGNQWQLWDNQLPHLAAAQEDIQLPNWPERIELTVYEGLLKMPGDFVVFIGYRLKNNGNIYYRDGVINFTVK